jgi:hypothetical protein
VLSPIQEAISESIKALMPTASAKEFSVFMKVLFGMSKFKDGETVRESARECGGDCERESVRESARGRERVQWPL